MVHSSPHSRRVALHSLVLRVAARNMGLVDLVPAFVERAIARPAVALQHSAVVSILQSRRQW